MKDQPSLDPQIIQELKNYHKNDLNSFIYQLHFRSRMLLENDKLPSSLVALEMLESVFSSMEEGHQHYEIADAYPNQSWREDTVEVPRDWIRELVNGWKKYKQSEAQATFGEAFGLEGGGQGSQPARHWLEVMNRNSRISNAVLFEYLAERASGKTASWERAYENVAAEEGISLDTVKRASKTMRDDTLNKLTEQFVLQWGKSS